VNQGRTMADSVAVANDAGELATANPDTVTAEDITRITAAIAALADPTGISGAIAAYTYPKCSKIT